MNVLSLHSDPSIVGSRGINLHWPEYTEQGQLVMHFTSGRCAARRSVLNRAVAFWHDIVPLVKISRAVLELPVAEPLSMTSSQVYLFEPSPQSLRAPLTQPVEQSAAYVVVALAVCNVLLLVVSAISITKLRKTQPRYETLEKL